MSSDIALFVDDGAIEGEVQRAGAEGAIGIVKLSFSLFNPTSIGQTHGAGTGKVECSQLTLEKLVDVSTTAIMKSVCEGTRYGTAKIVMHKQHGSESLEYLVIELENVVFESQAISDSQGAEMPTETLTLAYEEIRLRYTPQLDGGAPVEAGWNVVEVQAPV